VKIYLDNCCYNRPFDDQTQKRIFDETNSIFLGSDILILEISKIKNVQKQRQVLAFYSKIVNENINLTEEIENLAEFIVNQSKIHNLDALHLASAIIGDAKNFFTTDDKLIKSCEKLDLKISVMNPINFRGDFDEKN